MTGPSGNDKTPVNPFLDDERSFTEIYNRYWHRLFLTCYRRVKDKRIAEELVQNLFMKLWERRTTIKIEHLENYLFSSIRNATIDFLAKEMVADRYLEYRKVFAEIEANTTEEMVKMSDLEGAVEQGLRSLSRKSEKIFRLHKMNQWPVEKIATHLELSDKAVHYHLTKSLKFLRAYLREFTLSLLLLIH